MPYIKTKRDPMRKLIKGYELEGQKLAKVLNCSRKTAWLKAKETERLTIEDLKRLNIYGHIPIEEIRAAIQ